MSKITLNPPDGETPEFWLSRFDSRPTLCPTGLPESTRMALVCVRAANQDAETEGIVMLNPEQLRDYSNPDKHGVLRLFFRVPKAKLLDDPDICPGLTADSFWSSA